MAEVKKIATRDSYGNTLKELAAEAMTTWWCWTLTCCRHQDRYVPQGTPGPSLRLRHCRGNMMGVAAGLATMGYVLCFQLCHVCRRPCL